MQLTGGFPVAEVRFQMTLWSAFRGGGCKSIKLLLLGMEDLPPISQLPC